MDKVNLQNKRVLITGGNGYLGRNLVKQLVTYKADVFSIDIQDKCFLNGINYFQTDIRDSNKLKEIIQKINPEYIYHLAASLDRSRDFEITKEIFDINVNGTINLLNALADVEYENLIFTSTSEIYGGKNAKSPFKEDCDFIPASPYSLSKYAAEMSIKTFSELKNKNYIILRLFNFYGKGMPNSFFLTQLKEKIIKGEDFDMTEGEQKRDFIHINDVRDALILSTNENINNEVLNISTGSGKSIKDIAIQLKKDLNSNIKINFGALPYRENEIWEMVGDNTKAKKILGFHPTTKLKDF